MFDVYLACLSNAILHRRAAVQIELAVGLCVAHDFLPDAAQARVMLTNVYASAGYDCLKPDGGDYKTINRRVNTAFLLFDKIGADAIGAALGHLNGHHKIEAMQALLSPLQLCTYEDVMTFVGRPRNNTWSTTPAPTTEQHRRADDAPGVVHVRTAHIDVSVPPVATRVEVLDLVVKLVALSETLGKKHSHV